MAHRPHPVDTTAGRIRPTRACPAVWTVPLALTAPRGPVDVRCVLAYGHGSLHQSADGVRWEINGVTAPVVSDD